MKKRSWSDHGGMGQPDDIAFYKYKIIPRMLVDTTARDTSIVLFGKKLSAPICFSPVGINKVNPHLIGHRTDKVAEALIRYIIRYVIFFMEIIAMYASEAI